MFAIIDAEDSTMQLTLHLTIKEAYLDVRIRAILRDGLLNLHFTAIPPH